jgi:hypothetical protein
VNETPTSKYVSLSSGVAQEEEEKHSGSTQYDSHDAVDSHDTVDAPMSPHPHDMSRDMTTYNGNASYEGWSANEIEVFKKLVDMGMFSDLGYTRVYTIRR